MFATKLSYLVRIAKSFEPTDIVCPITLIDISCRW